jgi:MinD-like ATPase involved in chromosome partitioning or flagellar assembly
VYLCWSAKGGSGTTVVAAALALVLARSRPTVLVDMCGDTPAALGLAEPSGPGLTDWLASPTADVDALDRLSVEATALLRVLPRGTAPTPAAPRWAALADALCQLEDDVVVDAGSGEPPDHLAAAAEASILVTRSCYLSLRRLVGLRARPTGVVLVTEPGRSLRVADIEQAVGAPVIAEVPFDPHVCRAVDAGLLATRLPRSLFHALRNAA